jgi:hypothetical protein
MNEVEFTLSRAEVVDSLNKPTHTHTHEVVLIRQVMIIHNGYNTPHMWWHLFVTFI